VWNRLYNAAVTEGIQISGHFRKPDAAIYWLCVCRRTMTKSGNRSALGRTDASASCFSDGRCRARRQDHVQALHRPAAAHQVGGLLQGAVPRTKASAALPFPDTHRVAISNRRLVAGFWTPAAPRLSTRAAGRRPKSWTIDTNRKAALRRPLQGRERVKDQSARIVRPLFALR
jgi:hypothetical protein